jgi:hypothetical protein
MSVMNQDPRVTRVRKVGAVVITGLTILVGVIAWLSSHNIWVVLAVIIGTEALIIVLTALLAAPIIAVAQRRRSG